VRRDSRYTSETHRLQAHYAGGKDSASLTVRELALIDEFHIRGRKATVELADALQLTAQSHVLDIGSGLGGPARTVAELHGCFVTGLDLTPAFCQTAIAISNWIGVQSRVSFVQGDATALPFASATFDAAMSIHAAMNIKAKDKMYAEARRVLKPRARFGIYDVLQGEGGDVRFPVPWARESSLSHLARPDEMLLLLKAAGFQVVASTDSTEESLVWFEAKAAHVTHQKPVVTLQSFLGCDFPAMIKNQIINLREHRIRTVSYVCVAEG
jgi:ubiquinone/menaquinone biosynthesis C-methylase UbiE